MSVDVPGVLGTSICPMDNVVRHDSEQDKARHFSWEQIRASFGQIIDGKEEQRIFMRIISSVITKGDNGGIAHKTSLFMLRRENRTI